MAGTRFSLEIRPHIPPVLAGLEEVASNLIYSWDRSIRGLFYRLDSGLWEHCGHNPKLFLRRIAQEKLDRAAEDPVFLQEFRGVMSSYASYLEFRNSKGTNGYLSREDLVSYACAEYGVHESMPIYSGGLGILAGDYCKAMSDMDVPFVCVGILYRQGFFNQQIDAEGRQLVSYTPSNFEDIPVSCVRKGDGAPLVVTVAAAGRQIDLRVWLAEIGHIKLYLLDSDIESNSDEDRAITYQLYGGGDVNRLLQEMVLGIGGVRAQRALDLDPTVWHINEGHASFQIIERCRELVEQGLDFYAALEAVAANTVFTTHTPVAAGHDFFNHGLIQNYLGSYVKELGISMDDFLSLGASPSSDHAFNMTALALRGSRFHNGVSAIHGGVAARMEGYIWPEVDSVENPVGYVTNGIHVPTFLGREWVNYFDLQLGGSWRNELLNDSYWQCIDDIPEHVFWSRREDLKSRMAEAVVDRLGRQLLRNGFSPSQVARSTRYLYPGDRSVMIIGFARRFATYKRATLIFSDEARLQRLLNDPKKPVVFIFAGKAHPDDHPGQELMKIIYEYSRKPEFEGKILLVEGYDIAVARKLVSGVDVWLNTPEYPLEASGTSGQKAAINGVLNLSVLDGWWAEGYNGDNGWGIRPHGSHYTREFRDREEAAEMMDILENEVIPLYFKRNVHGYSSGWIQKAKASMKSMIPRFNSQRMVADYLRDHYGPASRHGRQLADDNYNNAQTLAAWKRKVRAAWPGVEIQRHDDPSNVISAEQLFELRVAVDLSDLNPDDLVVDCLIDIEEIHGQFKRADSSVLSYQHQLEDGRALFSLSLKPEQSGLLSYMIRVYPWHKLLGHDHEMGLMRWV